MPFSVKLQRYENGCWLDFIPEGTDKTVRDVLESLCDQPILAVINLGMETVFIAGQEHGYEHCRTITKKTMMARDALVKIEEIDSPILYERCILPMAVEMKKYVKGNWYTYPLVEFHEMDVREALLSLDNQPLLMIIMLGKEIIYLAGRKEGIEYGRSKGCNSLLVKDALAKMDELDLPVLYQKLIFITSSIFENPPEEGGPLWLKVPAHIQNSHIKPPKDAEPADERIASWLYEQGLKHLKEGNLQQAVQLLTQAADIENRNVKFRLALGESFEELGDQATALKEYEKAVEVDPRHWKPLFHKGKLLLDMGKNSQAVAVLEKSLSLRDQPETRERLANAYCASGDHEKAASMLGKSSRRRGALAHAA